MKISLVGKKALVGGSSSGIGKAIAIELASCGAEVTLMARDEEALQKVISELDSQHQQKHHYLVTDFTDYEKHKATIHQYFVDHTVDILVNNTNGPLSGGIFNKNERDYQSAFNLLFQQAVFTSMMALAHMKTQRYGRIINVSSMSVKEPRATLVLSNTMRSALVSWSKTLASEVARDGITVNSILTGFFDTQRLASLMQIEAEASGRSLEEIKASRTAAIPVERLGDPAEYGYLVAFLASKYAAFLTGTAIPLDGGAGLALL